jgi:putative addiction module CopG family antidote
MNVRLTPDQQAFVRDAIAVGRLHSEEEAVREALALWEERERRRAEILADIDVAEAALARGEGRELSEVSVHSLADAIKSRGSLAAGALGRQPRASSLSADFDGG